MASVPVAREFVVFACGCTEEVLRAADSRIVAQCRVRCDKHHALDGQELLMARRRPTRTRYAHTKRLCATCGANRAPWCVHCYGKHRDVWQCATCVARL